VLLTDVSFVPYYAISTGLQVPRFQMIIVLEFSGLVSARRQKNTLVGWFDPKDEGTMHLQNVSN
jgi:hypothetical protein